MSAPFGYSLNATKGRSRVPAFTRRSRTSMENYYLKLINNKENNVSIHTISNKHIYKIRKNIMSKYREC